jgi:cathepsin X
MKADLAKYGPIACGIMATQDFEKYTGGIYSEVQDWISINHEISVVGYGTDSASGQEYWIGRNSWGTYWGEGGFFRMVAGKNGLGIETDCVAAIPTFDKPDQDEQIVYIN